MKKTFLFLVAVCLFAAAASDLHAALLLVKMNADKTTLAIGETATIELYAHAPVAAGLNGLNTWQLSMLVGGDGAVSVLESSIAYTVPFTYDTLITSVNSPAGSIKDISISPKNPPEDSNLGVGGFTKIAEFVIEAVGAGQVTYTIGDAGVGGGFFGILRDYNPMDPGDNYLDGSFELIGSDNQFTIVPEPATFALLGGMGLILLRSRKSGRL